MNTIFLDDYLSDKIIKEKEFRQKIEETNWKKYLDKKVLIKGCAKSPIPTWAYLIIATELTKHTSKIYFGEKCSAIKIF